MAVPWLYWRSTSRSSLLIRYSRVRILENSRVSSTSNRVRAKKLRGSSGCQPGPPFTAAGHPARRRNPRPTRLDIARLGRMRFQQPAQAGDLHIDGALQGVPFPAPGQLHQLVPGQGHTGVVQQLLAYRGVAGGQHVDLVAPFQLPGGQAEHKVAEGHLVVLDGRCPGNLRRLAAQYGLDAGHQLTGVERLGQVVVGAQLQPLDTAGFVALGGEHDDRGAVALLAQALAGLEPILAGQHQVEHYQRVELAIQQPVHLCGVLDGAHAVTLFAEKTLQQTAQPGIVVDDEYLFAFRIAHKQHHLLVSVALSLMPDAGGAGHCYKSLLPNRPDCRITCGQSAQGSNAWTSDSVILPRLRQLMWKAPMDSIAARIASELAVRPEQVVATVALLDEGASVPFISRYRKEVTGSLDDTQLRQLEERLRYLRELEDRRSTILASIQEQGKLTPELERDIRQAETKTTLEDLYLPYKPKRRTRGQIALEA